MQSAPRRGLLRPGRARTGSPCAAPATRRRSGLGSDASAALEAGASVSTERQAAPPVRRPGRWRPGRSRRGSGLCEGIAFLTSAIRRADQGSDPPLKGCAEAARRLDHPAVRAFSSGERHDRFRGGNLLPLIGLDRASGCRPCLHAVGRRRRAGREPPAPPAEIDALACQGRRIGSEGGLAGDHQGAARISLITTSRNGAASPSSTAL